MSHKIQIDESVIFVSVICHRRSDTNSRIIFFSVHLQTLALKFSSALTSIGIIFSASSINKSILQLILYGVFEFLEYVIVVKQYMFAYAYHTIQQAVLLNRSIIIFYNPKNFKKYFLRVSAISKMSVKRFWIFNYSKIWILYFFVSATILKLKRGVGISHQQADFVNTMYWQNLSLRPPVEVKFLLPAIWEIFRNFFISHQIQFVIQ